MSEFDMNPTSHILMDDSTLNTAKVKVFGVGGAGGNTVNRMVGMNIEGVEYYAVNTDAMALDKSQPLGVSWQGIWQPPLPKATAHQSPQTRGNNQDP